MKIKQFISIIGLTLFIGNGVWANPKSEKTRIFDTITTNFKDGQELEFVFEKGKAHNHPTFAIWIEDMVGNYIQHILITQFIATGIYGHAPTSDSTWGTEPGIAYRPAALPYWNHKRRVQPKIEKIMPGKNDPIPDAYTAATPEGSFVLHTKTEKTIPEAFRILIEINQTWDWNSYWTNNKFPNDMHYKTSCQPSVVYAVTVNTNTEMTEYWLNPIGHGHYSGGNGNLYTNLSTITTALDIYKTIKVTIKK